MNLSIDQPNRYFTVCLYLNERIISNSRTVTEYFTEIKGPFFYLESLLLECEQAHHG